VPLNKAKVIKAEKRPWKKIWGKNSKFFEKVLFRSDELQVNLRRIPKGAKFLSKKGERISAGGQQLHSHGKSDEFIYVFSGKGKGFYEGAGLIDVTPDILICMPHGTKHGSASVDKTLTMLSIFIPPPEETEIAGKKAVPSLY
jgi:mannose-6-phosphate isomerase-like protein (cupin superfamily)